MRENEAKTKWCPFVRMHVIGPDGDDLAGHNRIVNYDQPSTLFIAATPSLNCIGSQCMAWRWGDFLMDATERSDAAQGYCGLAGKPVSAGRLP